MFSPLLGDPLHAELVAVFGILLVQQRCLQEVFPRARLVTRGTLGQPQSVAVLGAVWVY